MAESITFVDHSEVKLVKREASDLMVCDAAWVSTGDDDKLGVVRHRLNGGFGEDVDKARARMRGLIEFLYRERHMSPFEHGSFTFRVSTPIFVAREFMRHRTFSYNEESTRYAELAPRFFLIDSERPLKQTGKVGAYRFEAGTDEQYGSVYAQTTTANIRAWNAYQEMLKEGVAREVARNVLPLNIMTSFYVTGNPRNWMQFFLLRNDKNALVEIRSVAAEIEEVFANTMPMTHVAFKKYDYRAEKAELAELRAYKAQEEAWKTYSDNIDFVRPTQPLPDLYSGVL